jgi:hypothetical protein
MQAFYFVVPFVIASLHRPSCHVVMYYRDMYRRSILLASVDGNRSFIGILSRKVLQAALGISLHGLSTLLPSSRANLAVLISELESLDETDGLLDVAADGEIVDGDLAENTLGVDDEETAESDALVLDQNAVGAGDLGGLVGDEGELQVRTETALLAGLLDPGEMGEVGVGGDAEDGGVDLLEAVEGVVVLDDFGRADKGEVHGVEEKDDPLTLIVRELDVAELASREEGGGRELGSLALNESLRHVDGVVM